MDSLDNQNRYKAIFELAPDVVYTISKVGKITSLSSAFEKITGYKRSEWLGKNFAGIVHPVDLPKALVNFKKSLEGKDVPYYKLRIKIKSGEYILGEFKSAPDIVDGKVVGVIGIGRDITKEQAEQESLIHYKHLVQSADSAIMSRDLEGKVLSWNKAAEKLFGYKAAEIVGESFSKLIPKRNSDELRKIDRRIKRGESFESYETIRVRKDGKELDIVAKISPIKDESGKVVGVSLFDRDNTAVKRERDAKLFLSEASKLLSSSLNYNVTLKKLSKIVVPSLADWFSVHVIDESNNPRQLTVAHKNPKLVKLALELQQKYKKNNEIDKESLVYKVATTGKSQIYKKITDEMIRKTIKDKEDLALVEKLKLRSVIMVPLISGRKILGVITLVSSDENKLYDEYDLDFAKELGKMAGQAVDNAKLYYEAQREIEKRRLIEDQLRESRDELDVILQSVADGITVQDSKGRLIYANDSAAVSSGYQNVAEMLLNPDKWVKNFELKDEEGEPFSFRDLPGRRVLMGEKSATATVNFVNKKTGQESWAMIKASPVYDIEGRVKAVVNIIDDITQRKELERKKDDFISIASHELKTPVTSIKGFTHLLKLKGKPENMLYIDKIDRQLGKLTELIEDLLEVSRSRAGKLVYKREKFSISRLVGEVISDLQASVDHSILFKNGVKQKVYGDKDRIAQVLINLITNAAKYSPNSDKIKVELKDDEDGVVVSVKDYGIGMDSDETEKIFERFYRVKDARNKTFPGLGIGLYISKEIVERHEGKIWVESEKGKGSVFYFKLPGIYER